MASMPFATHCSELPFDFEQQLCPKLHFVKEQNVLVRTSSNHEIQKDWLPGYPRARLQDKALGKLLYREFATPKLDSFSKYLWLVERPDSSHIASLTHQQVRGRRIVITEDPELHLVWIHDRVFVKPLPKYLLSQAFWEFAFHDKSGTFEDDQHATAARQAASGFLRSYAFLIVHKSDFEQATRSDHRLICKDIRFRDLVQLLETVVQRTPDDIVGSRWKYGELRLSRLNLWSRLLFRRETFTKVHGQYSEYVAQFYAPLLFMFATLSVVLSAMQVGLAVEPVIARNQYTLLLSEVSKVFVVFALVLIAAAIAWFLTAIMAVIVRMIFLGLRTQIRGHRTLGSVCCIDA